MDQIWFFEHHLRPRAPVPSPNLLIAAAARTTQRIRFSSMVNILPFRHPLLVAEEAAMLDNLTGGRFDMGLGRGPRPPEFEAFGVDQERSREMFLESFEIIRRVWADENFVHRGKYWTVQKHAPLSPPLVQHSHPPFLVSAQSEESLRGAAQYDIPFAQIDSMVEQAKRDQALYREVQTAHGHAPAARLYFMRETLCRRHRNRVENCINAIERVLESWHLRIHHPGMAGLRQGRVGSSSDSPLERDGFEPSVPPPSPRHLRRLRLSACQARGAGAAGRRDRFLRRPLSEGMRWLANLPRSARTLG